MERFKSSYTDHQIPDLYMGSQKCQLHVISWLTNTRHSARSCRCRESLIEQNLERLVGIRISKREINVQQRIQQTGFIVVRWKSKLQPRISTEGDDPDPHIPGTLTYIEAVHKSGDERQLFVEIGDAAEAGRLVHHEDDVSWFAVASYW